MSTRGITEADQHADAQTHYADIFSSPHWEPTSRKPSGLLSHPRMPIDKRAAMFASFDALVGYKEAVSETIRTTDERAELSESELEELNRRLQILINKTEASSPSVSITYFIPDPLKDGGSYVTVTGEVQKIDLYQRLISLSDGKTVNMDDVVKIDGDIFTPGISILTYLPTI